MTTVPDARAADWSTTHPLDAVADRLAGARSVLIHTHGKPDGDAVGSTLAVARALRARTPNPVDAAPVYAPPWPRRFDGVVGSTPVHHLRDPAANPPDESKPLAADLPEPDLHLVLDTGAWSQLEAVAPVLKPAAERTIIVDHHRHGDPDAASMRHVDPSAAAVCELAAPICVRVLGLDSSTDLPPEIATPLYLGLATDTGWFRFPNTTPATLRLAADLQQAGVNADELFQLSEQSDTPARLQLLRRALSSLELVEGDAVAVMSLSRNDFNRTGATMDESGGFVDIPKTVGTVQAVALITEVADGVVKVSMRSKAARDGARDIDVNQVAQQFGGGGHIHAAGARLTMPLDDARALVTRALADAARTAGA